MTGADDVDLDIFFYHAGSLNLKTEKASQKMSTPPAGLTEEQISF